MRMCLLALAFTCLGPFSRSRAFEPESDYKSYVVEGFTVLVNAKVAEHEKEAVEVREEIESQLKQVVKVLTPEQLTALQKVRFWVEWDAKPRGGAEFHPSAGWLKEHGYNPAKHRGIEISNTRNFVTWSREYQPWCVMHELAHAHHFLVLGENNADVAAAYKQAMERKLYDSVKHANGKPGKAYAARNKFEYFAELTEAYLGKNDFEPFIRPDLEKHDPVGYRLMTATWGSR